MSDYWSLKVSYISCLSFKTFQFEREGAQQRDTLPDMLSITFYMSADLCPNAQNSYNVYEKYEVNLKGKIW